MKDGDNFDTKKAAKEKSVLVNFAQYFQLLLAKNDLQYTVQIKICAFNQMNKNAIVQGFKKQFSIQEVMTGQDFCNLLGISYQTICVERNMDNGANLDYFCEQLIADKFVLKELTNKIENESACWIQEYISYNLSPNSKLFTLA